MQTIRSRSRPKSLYHAALGYRSRSALINDVLAEKREEVEDDDLDQ
jgi:hypothetical protein